MAADSCPCVASSRALTHAASFPPHPAPPPTAPPPKPPFARPSRRSQRKPGRRRRSGAESRRGVWRRRRSSTIHSVTLIFSSPYTSSAAHPTGGAATTPSQAHEGRHKGQDRDSQGDPCGGAQETLATSPCAAVGEANAVPSPLCPHLLSGCSDGGRDLVNLQHTRSAAHTI
ncbi:unnamed protein product [Urochloa humidicola]